jgi:hypothetical protein
MPVLVGWRPSDITLDMPRQLVNYWTYSIGFAVAWGIVLAIVFASKREQLNSSLLVFAGASIGWLSGTIARYVYPPPRRWHQRP